MNIKGLAILAGAVLALYYFRQSQYANPNLKEPRLNGVLGPANAG